MPRITNCFLQKGVGIYSSNPNLIWEKLYLVIFLKAWVTRLLQKKFVAWSDGQKDPNKIGEFHWEFLEVYSEPCKTSRIKSFAKVVKVESLQLFSWKAKSSMLDSDYNTGQNIWNKIEKSTKIDRTRKVWYLLSSVFWLLLPKFNFLKRDWTRLYLHLSPVWHFPNIF